MKSTWHETKFSENDSSFDRRNSTYVLSKHSNATYLSSMSSIFQPSVLESSSEPPSLSYLAAFKNSIDLRLEMLCIIHRRLNAPQHLLHLRIPRWLCAPPVNDFLETRLVPEALELISGNVSKIHILNAKMALDGVPVVAAVSAADDKSIGSFDGPGAPCNRVDDIHDV